MGGLNNISFVFEWAQRDLKLVGPNPFRFCLSYIPHTIKIFLQTADPLRMLRLNSNNSSCFIHTFNKRSTE